MKNIQILLLLFFGIQHYSQAQKLHWYKGNTHCHTLVSDGKNQPKDVVAAYHNHGYNFLVITDHNFLLETDTIKKPANLRNDFLLVPGEEVTDRIAVHTTAFNISHYVPFDNDPNRETDLVKRQSSVLKLVKEFDAVFVDFQQIFDQACQRADADYWMWDGVHPTVAGHELMAREWRIQVGKRLKFVS